LLCIASDLSAIDVGKGNRKKSFANAVKGQLGGSLDSQLMGWRCKAGGSWDVFAVVIGEGQHGSCNEQDRQVPSKDGFVEASLSPSKTCGANVCADVNPLCANQFKVLRDILVNYPSSDGESSSQTNSPSA